jgi:hypothetical protein
MLALVTTVVDDDALFWALDDGRIGAAAAIVDWHGAQLQQTLYVALESQVKSCPSRQKRAQCDWLRSSEGWRMSSSGLCRPSAGERFSTTGWSNG